MAHLDPDEAATIAHGTWVAGRPSSPLTTFSIDTRVLEAGQTFVALRTDVRDGHAFLRMARERQALAALVSSPDDEIDLPQLVVEDPRKSLQSLARVWRQRFTGPVMGITGSFGKTTVREMLGTVLGSQWLRSRRNLNNVLGVPLTLLELDPRHYAGGIIEAGINMPGEMELLADLIDPDLAVITAVGPAHLEQLGNIEGVAREKARLGRAVRPGGKVILRGSLLKHAPFRDLPEGVRIEAVCLDAEDREGVAADGSERVEIFTYKWTESPSARGAGTLQSTHAAFPGAISFRPGSPGMVSNLVLVVHVALTLNVPIRTIRTRLEGWRPYHQRGETYRHGGRVYYLDCYNANPGSMVDSVRRFQNLFADQPHLYVLGSMEELGKDSGKWHRETAGQLSLPGDSPVYLVGDGAEWLRDGLRDGGHASRLIQIINSPSEAAPAIDAFTGAVFIKGSRRYKLETLLPEGARRC